MTVQKPEHLILRNLIQEPEFVRKVLPYIKDEYFLIEEDRILFNQIKDFTLKYNVPPSCDALEIEVNALKGLKEDQVKIILGHISDFRTKTEKSELDYLVDLSEKFCKDKAVYLGIMKSIEILNDKSGKLSTGAIPQILEDAIGVSFDSDVGHDWLNDHARRFDYYHSVTERVPFDLKILNLISKNGLPRKSLSVIMGDTGGGKSLVMCHMSAAALLQGKNVLYITMELSEEEVGKRIDQNLFNITVDDLMKLTDDQYKAKFETFKKKTTGKLFIKQFPTGDANAIMFKTLLNELKLKEKFKPDIIFIDYINICTSARLKMGNNVSSYTYIKSIAEEFRGLAILSDLPIVTATQTNRTGFSSTDVDMNNVSESWGLPHTADFMIALINSEELIQLGQIMIKQLKNRWNDLNYYKRFVIGIDRSRMKLFDLEDSAQDNIVDTGTTAKKDKDDDKKDPGIFGSVSGAGTAKKFKNFKVD